MKFFTWFIVLLIAFALMDSSSAQRCEGRPRFPNCVGGRSIGHRGAGCIPRTMYYYDLNHRICLPLRYLGCGGNNNRWCTKASCDLRCNHT